MEDNSLKQQHISTKVILGYLSYIRKKFPKIDVEDLVCSAGLDLASVESNDQWVSIQFVSLFMKEVLLRTGDSELPYKVGRASVSEEAAGAVMVSLAKYALTTAGIYRSGISLSRFINKTYSFEITKNERSNIYLRIVPNELILKDEALESYKEDFQNLLENTRGWLEAIPELQGHPPAVVKVIPNYNIKIPSAEFQIKLSASVSTSPAVQKFATLCLAAALSWFISDLLTFNQTAKILATLAILAISRAISMYKVASQMEHALRKSEDALSALDRQYQEIQETQIALKSEKSRVELLKEILEPRGKNTLEEWLDSSLKKIASRLGIARVLLFLTDYNETTLRAIAFAGADAELVEKLKSINLPMKIDKDGDSKISNVFWNKKTALVTDSSVHAESGDADSKAIISFSKSTSFLAVAVYTDKRRYGVLVADRGPNGQPMSDKELEVLEPVARQLATVIERERVLEVQNKFVPWQSLRLLGCESILDVRINKFVQLDLSVLFCDIRGFTNLCESMRPDEVYRFVNSIWRALAPVIKSNGGFVDKFVGDQIMAIFETPSNCFLAAAELIEALKKYNQKNRNNDPRSPIRIGIGINSGSMIIGPVGEDDRLSITVLANDVNLGTRFEELTKLYGCRVVAPTSLCLREATTLSEAHRSLGPIRIRGTDLILEVSEVFFSDEPDIRNFKYRWKHEFDLASSFYGQGQYQQAIKIYSEIVSAAKSENLEDQAASQLLARCKAELGLRRAG